MATRRAVLRAAVVGAIGSVAGCLQVSSDTVPVEIGIINNQPEIRLVRVKITDQDETVLVDTELEVHPSGSAHRDEPAHPSTTISRLFSMGTVYRFGVSVADGPSRTTRVTVDCPAERGGDQWTARLRSGGGILVHDSSC